MAGDEDPLVVTVFRSRLRDGAGPAGYPAPAVQMEELARAMPGFVSLATYLGEDGERLSVIVFDSWEHHRSWPDHPDHREARRRGREQLYESYSVIVAEHHHHHDFPGGGG